MAPPVTPPAARSVQTTWTYTLLSMTFFFLILGAILVMSALVRYGTSESLTDAILLILFVLTVATQIRACWFLRAGRGGGLPSPEWMLALFVPAIGAWLLGLTTPGAGFLAALPLWMSLNVVAPLLSGKRVWGALALGAVATAVHPVLATLFGHPIGDAQTERFWLLLVYSVLLPVMVLSGLWWWNIVVALDRTRTLTAELAVTEERLRFASDLHDIQGHHLQVIALKSELAERIIAIDPASAQVHVHEIRLIASQALEETRSLVSGYRKVTLDDELAGAREVLEASGAACEFTIDALPEDPAVRRVLALVIREATTNILRHSEATQTTLRLRHDRDGTVLEISNDAISPDAAPSRSEGTGLAGLAERVNRVGGTLDAAADARGTRFQLRVTVPVGAAATSTPPVTA